MLLIITILCGWFALTILAALALSARCPGRCRGCSTVSFGQGKRRRFTLNQILK